MLEYVRYLTGKRSDSLAGYEHLPVDENNSLLAERRSGEGYFRIWEFFRFPEDSSIRRLP